MDTLTLRGKKEKINFFAPHELRKRAQGLAKEFGFSLSDLLRETLARVVEDLERKKLDREVEEACKNYYDFNKQFSSDWAKFETRIE